MIEYVLNNLDVFSFYFVSGILIFAGFLLLTKKYEHKFLISMLFSVLIVFVSSEFWEIPIFFMAYVGAPGYGSPEVLNHVIVGLMSFLLLLIIGFKMNKENRCVILYDLLFNVVFLLVFPGIISAWFLRAGSLLCLSYVFIWELRNHD